MSNPTDPTAAIEKAKEAADAFFEYDSECSGRWSNHMQDHLVEWIWTAMAFIRDNADSLPTAKTAAEAAGIAGPVFAGELIASPGLGRIPRFPIRNADGHAIASCWDKPVADAIAAALNAPDSAPVAGNDPRPTMDEAKAEASTLLDEFASGALFALLNSIGCFRPVPTPGAPWCARR